MVQIKIGVLALQGAVSEHVGAVKAAFKESSLEGSVINIKTKSDLDNIHGLIIPGGESTTIGKVSKAKDLLDKIFQMGGDKLPILGTCAGAILLAKEVSDVKIGIPNQPLLGLMNIKVTRNSFGRQRESFEHEIEIPILGKKPFLGVFIRAPIIEQICGDVEVLAKYENKIVAAKQGNIVATSFHPELTNDLRLHQYFINLALQ